MAMLPNGLDDLVYRPFRPQDADVYCHLHYSLDINGRKWSLSFQQKPTWKVLASGDRPTTEELVHALEVPFQPHWPASTIGILQSIVGTLWGDADKLP